MERPLVLKIESHLQAATLYLAGTLTAAGVARVAAECDALPASVSVLRVSAGSLAPSDPHAVVALYTALCRWRSGTTHPTRRPFRP